MIEYSPAMLEAWRKTVEAYERLIESGNFDGWEHYGEYCRLCDACDDCYDCDECVLVRHDGGGCSQGGMSKSIEELKNAIASCDPDRIVVAATVRLAALRQRAAENGVQCD